MAIRICQTSATHQHFAPNGIPFTVRVHSAAIVQASGRRAAVICYGFGETASEALAAAVRDYRLGMARAVRPYELGSFPGLATAAERAANDAASLLQATISQGAGIVLPGAPDAS